MRCTTTTAASTPRKRFRAGPGGARWGPIHPRLGRPHGTGCTCRTVRADWSTSWWLGTHRYLASCRRRRNEPPSRGGRPGESQHHVIRSADQDVYLLDDTTGDAGWAPRCRSSGAATTVDCIGPPSGSGGSRSVDGAALSEQTRRPAAGRSAAGGRRGLGRAHSARLTAAMGAIDDGPKGVRWPATPRYRRAPSHGHPHPPLDPVGPCARADVADAGARGEHGARRRCRASRFAYAGWTRRYTARSGSEPPCG